MPGVTSLSAYEYYAHPRNSFWWIMSEMLGNNFDTNSQYSEKLDTLHSAGIVLWDVLQRCERRGSLDSAIIADSEQANDIASLVKNNPSIQVIAFNGKKASLSFKKHIKSCQLFEHIQLIDLPSTSPAYAAISKVDKLTDWRQLEDFLSLN